MTDNINIIQKKKKKSLFYSFEKNYLGYLPSILIKGILDKKILSNKKNSTLPASFTFHGVTMYIDISHFIDFSVNISHRNRLSPEFLQFCLNHYFEILISIISNNGGDIIKFVGDGVFIVWSPDNKENERYINIHKYNENMRICSIKALQCAMDIHKNLYNQEIIKGYSFNVKIGIGIGDISLIVVGGYDNSYEYICLGPSILEALECEKKAIDGEDLIISDSVYKIVKDYFLCEDLIITRHSIIGQKFYRVIKPTNLFVRQINKSTINLMKNKYNDLIVKNSNIFSQFLPYLTNFMALSKQYERWLKEIRILTIMFLTLNIEISDEQKQTFQNIIYKLQEISHNSYGTINKIILDDKGISILLIWGLAPNSFTGDTSFSVRASFEIWNFLNKLNIDCQIGIGTGLCFCGVCGNIGGRREYSVISDVVNNAVSCMEISKEIINYPKIIFDEKSRLMLSPHLKYRFFKKCIPKGYKSEQNFYIPLLEDYDNTKKNIYNPFPFILTHIQNPLNKDQVDEDIINENKYYLEELYDASNKMVGRVKKHRRLLQILKDFVDYKNHVKLIIIKGLIGCGKSLFVRRTLIDFLNENRILSDVYFNEDINNINDDKEEKFNKNIPFIFSFKTTIDNILFGNENSKNEFNGFKSYLKKIFKVLFSDSTEKNKLLELIKFRNCIKYLNFFNRYFEINEDLKNYFINEQIGNNDFIYDESKNDLIYFFFDMIILYRKYISEIIKIKFNYSPSFQIPIIFIIEDMQYKDQYTLDFIKEYLNPSENLEQFHKDSNLSESQFLIIMLYRESLYKELIPNEIFTIDLPNEMDTETDYIKIFYLPRLYNDNKISTLIKNSIKHYRNIEIQNVSPIILKFLLNKSYNGIPFFIIKLLLSLWDTDKIYVNSENTLTEKKELVKMIKYNDYTNLKVPFFIEKMISSIIDKNLDVDDCIILKLASILGNIFDTCKLKQLIKLENKHLFMNFKMKDRNFIYGKIKRYEQLNLIEILYDLDINHKFVVAKFSIPFLREIFYQRMLFDYRSHVHYVIGKMLKITLPDSYYNLIYINEDMELKILKHHLKMGETSIRAAISSYITKSDDSKVMIKKKKSKIVHKILKDDELNINDLKTLIIQQVCTKIGSIKINDDQDNMIKSGFIEKKSNGKLTWEKRFFVLTSNRVIYYYNESDYKDTTISPLGSFYLYNVFSIQKLNDYSIRDKTNLFSVDVTEWIKKGEIQKNRTYYLRTQTREEMYKWMITLNILKIKAFYDKYCLGYGYVNFPLYNRNKNEMLLRVKKLNFEIDELNNLTSSPIQQRERRQNLIQYQIKKNKRMSIFSPYFVYSYNENIVNFDEYELYTLRYLIKNTKFILKYFFFAFFGVLQNNIVREKNNEEDIDFKIPNHLYLLLTKQCNEDYEKLEISSIGESSFSNSFNSDNSRTPSIINRNKTVYSKQQIEYLDKFYHPEKEFNTVIYKVGKNRNSDIYNDRISKISFDYSKNIGEEESKGSFADQSEEKIDHDDYLKYPEYIRDPSLQNNIIELKNCPDFKGGNKSKNNSSTTNPTVMISKNNSLKNILIFDTDSEKENLKDNFENIKFNRNKELNRRRKKIMDDYKDELERQKIENKNNDDKLINDDIENINYEENSLKLNLQLDSNSLFSESSEDSLKKSIKSSPRNNQILNNDEEIKYISEEEIKKERKMSKKMSTKRKNSSNKKRTITSSKNVLNFLDSERSNKSNDNNNNNSYNNNNNNKINNNNNKINSNKNNININEITKVNPDFDFGDFLRNYSKENNNLLNNISFIKENKDNDISIIKKNDSKTNSENNINFTCGEDNRENKEQESNQQQQKERKISITINKKSAIFTLQKNDESSNEGNNKKQQRLSFLSLLPIEKNLEPFPMKEIIEKENHIIKRSVTNPLKKTITIDNNSLCNSIKSENNNDNNQNNNLENLLLNTLTNSNKSFNSDSENSNSQENEEESSKSIKQIITFKDNNNNNNNNNNKETEVLINKLKKLDIAILNEADYFSNGIVMNSNLNISSSQKNKNYSINKSFYSDMESVSTRSNGDFFNYPNYFYINNPNLHNKTHVSKFFSTYRKHVNNN